MKFQGALALLPLLTLLGCASDSYLNHYTVFIDPEFKDGSKMIYEGVDEWTYISNGELTFDFRFEAKDSPGDGEIVFKATTWDTNIGPSGKALGNTHIDSSMGAYLPQATITLATDHANADPTTLRRVTAHEMGHALGIHGHTGPETIMAPAVNVGAPWVTCADLQTLRAEREDSRTDCKAIPDNEYMPSTH